MAEFTYSLISDMHIDYPQQKTPYDLLEKNVIVAGDTSNGLEGLKFLQKLRNKGFTVFATEGNHEHYRNVSQGRTFAMTTERFREDFPVIADIDEKLTLVSLNGWYRVAYPMSWYRHQKDCRNMYGKEPYIGAKYVNDLAVFEADFLNDLLESFHDRKFIVTTHTAPCVETLDPKFYGHDSNEWYWSPFMRQVLAAHSDKILIWNHGHTHASNEAVVDGVRVVCNPRGYPGENPGWIPKTITVEY